MDDRTTIIEYAEPPDSPRRTPATALLLCAPGAICWLEFFAALAGLPLPGIVYGCFIPLWLIAIGAAVSSLVIYALFTPTPCPWFIRINLWVNIPGLLFSIYAIVTDFHL